MMGRQEVINQLPLLDYQRSLVIEALGKTPPESQPDKEAESRLPADIFLNRLEKMLNLQIQAIELDPEKRKRLVGETVATLQGENKKLKRQKQILEISCQKTKTELNQTSALLKSVRKPDWETQLKTEIEKPWLVFLKDLIELLEKDPYLEFSQDPDWSDEEKRDVVIQELTDTLRFLAEALEESHKEKENEIPITVRAVLEGFLQIPVGKLTATELIKLEQEIRRAGIQFDYTQL